MDVYGAAPYEGNNVKLETLVRPTTLPVHGKVGQFLVGPFLKGSKGTVAREDGKDTQTVIAGIDQAAYTQTEEVLRAAMSEGAAPLNAELLRRILREELYHSCAS